MSAPPAIETEGLTKEYGRQTAVDGLDLEVSRGTVYGFLGPNGSGKSTTIRMLTSLLRPTDGSAWIAGTPISDREAVTRHLGYLPESPPLYEEFTAREQLEYVAGLHDLPERAAAERIESLLDRFDLRESADRRIATYSKGMQQKTAIVQAILHEPAVVFLDEPTSGLDPRAARIMKDVIADLAGGDTTVFLSTHILPVVDELAEVVGVLADGTLVAEGAPAILKERVEGGESTLEDVFIDVTSERTAADRSTAPTAGGDG
jgi:ABC-2 type transport system ATP-binding protein